uniref:Rh187 n=1 Tax=Heterorhabditis bacteriophora TaxID=37862 RepID=A0A1I7WWN7_HETBA
MKTIPMLTLLSALFSLLTIASSEVCFVYRLKIKLHANFEDTRCRCVCPSTMYFVGDNHSDENDNHRRYYTMTDINPGLCNPQSVVKGVVAGVVDDSHIDAFLANCDCRHESRNTVMLKLSFIFINYIFEFFVVVIFVMCVIMVLVTYMGFLMCLDPMLRKKRFQIPYRQQNDEMEDNIFARVAESSSAEYSTAPPSTMRARSSSIFLIFKNVINVLLVQILFFGEQAHLIMIWTQ